MEHMRSDKKLTLKATQVLMHALQDTPFDVIDVRSRYAGDDIYTLDIALAITHEDVATALLQKSTRTATSSARVADEMIDEVARNAEAVYGGKFTPTKQDGQVKLTRDDGAVEIEFSDQELQFLGTQEETIQKTLRNIEKTHVVLTEEEAADDLGMDDDYVITNAQFDGKPLPEGAILTGKQMKQRLQERMQTPFEEEKQHNQELLDLGELDEQLGDLTSAKPATVQDAQKQTKVVRRRQEKPKYDPDETGEALSKRSKPKPVTAAQNMETRKVSREEMQSLASSFEGDWEEDIKTEE